jgi:hypothetical protein
MLICVLKKFTSSLNRTWSEYVVAPDIDFGKIMIKRKLKQDSEYEISDFNGDECEGGCLLGCCTM